MAQIIADDIRLTAPAPAGVLNLSVTVVGSPGVPGPQRFWYWVVANYPVGSVVSGPVLARAPAELSPDQFVRVSWNLAPNATSYVVVRSSSPEFPVLPANAALSPGATAGASLDDTGLPLVSTENLPLASGAPASCQIHLNNRDYSRVTLQLPCSVSVTEIVFPDGSSQTTAGGGGGGQNQTPWLSDIDAAGNRLNNVLSVNGTSAGYLNLNTNANVNLPGAQFTQSYTYLNLRTVAYRQFQVGYPGINSGVDPWLITTDPTTKFVGIMVGTPAYRLDVAGNINIIDPGGANGYAFRVNGAPISTGPAGANTQVQFNSSGAFGADTAFTFQNIGGSRLLTLGAPQSQLAFSTTDGSPASIVGPSPSGLFVAATQSLGPLLMSAGPGGSIAFSAGPVGGPLSERMRIAANGNVGIGTTNPGSKLSIVGLPTSASGLVAGDVWNNGGALNIV